MATTTTFNGKKVHQGMIKSQKTRVGDFIIAFIIFLTMMICLLPMVNVLASSLSSSEHLIRNDVFLWPKGWNFEAYKTILSDSKYTWSLAWTGILTVVCTVLSLVLTVCTAFPLIYKNLRGGKVINFIILFTMYFSADAGEMGGNFGFDIGNHYLFLPGQTPGDALRQPSGAVLNIHRRIAPQLRL